MTSKEMLKLAESVGLGPKEFAHLLGVSARTMRGGRGVKAGGTADILLLAIQERLKDPLTAMSVRALMIIAARGEGLKMMVLKLLSAYSSLDNLRAP